MTGKEFEIRQEAVVAASPEQVWDAIATGSGISSWFIGRTDITGDVVRTSFGDDWIPAGTVTARDEPHRFAYRSQTAPDGRYIAYEYLIEGRDHASAVLRAVTSGFLPGDTGDWAGEYEAMGYGTDLFFASLTEYLEHFAGRTGKTRTAFGPGNEHWDDLVAGLDHGMVYFANAQTIGIRTTDALHRYLRGLHGAIVTDIITFE